MPNQLGFELSFTAEPGSGKIYFKNQSPGGKRTQFPLLPDCPLPVNPDTRCRIKHLQDGTGKYENPLHTARKVKEELLQKV